MNRRRQSRRIATVVGIALAAASVVGAATTVGSDHRTTAREAAYAKPFKTTLTATFPAKARQFVATVVIGKGTSTRAVEGSCEVQSRKAGGAWKSVGFGGMTKGRCRVSVKFPLAGRVQARMRFTALDQFKNSKTAPAFVKVAANKDRVAPVIELQLSPENAFNPEGVVVRFSPFATDDRDGTVPATCTPASDSLFPVGQTTVTCTATDKAGNVGTISAVQTVTYVGN